MQPALVDLGQGAGVADMAARVLDLSDAKRAIEEAQTDILMKLDTYENKKK